MVQPKIRRDPVSILFGLVLMVMALIFWSVTIDGLVAATSGSVVVAILTAGIAYVFTWIGYRFLTGKA